MKVGDMVMVRYKDTERWHYGVIIETPADGDCLVWRMWCGERERTHILAPHLDEIEMISEGG